MARTATRTARTATAPAKAATPTLARTPDGGVILAGLPFHVDGVGRTFLIMGGKGMGWTHDKAAGGWVTSTPGAAAECLAVWEGHGVEVIDLTGNAKAATRTRTAKAATATAPAKAATRTRTAKAATAPAKAATADDNVTIGELIGAPLAKAGVPADVIAEIILAAHAVTSAHAKAATAKATGTRTAKAATARTAKAATAKAASGQHVASLPRGTRVKAAAKAIRDMGARVVVDREARTMTVTLGGKVTAKRVGEIIAAHGA